MIAGITPAVALIDPKYARNVGGVYRSCAAFGAEQLWYTGDRAESEWLADGRLPREERIRGYKHVKLVKGEGRFLSAFPRGTVIIGVEVHPGAQVMTLDYPHPLDAVYVFGPEDGSLPKGIRTACHQFLIIPSDAPLNLYAAVTSVLLHRRLYLQSIGLEPIRSAFEVMEVAHA